MKNALAALVFCFALTMPASLCAANLQTNQWYEFSFTSVGVPALGCYPADMSMTALNCIPSAGNNAVFAPTPPWVFNVRPGSVLFVTDAFLYGDAFAVQDNGAAFFTTPPKPFTGSGCLSDPIVCLFDIQSSHFGAPLPVGMNSITITPYQIGDAGAAYFEVTGPTPEPNELVPAALAMVFALSGQIRKLRR